jgi:hypothetical protein
VRRACAFFLELLMAIVEGLWANQEVEPLQVEPIHWIAVGLQAGLCSIRSHVQHVGL